MKLILGSKSPRRREILSKEGYEFTVVTAETDETLPEGTAPGVGVEMLAVRKGEAVEKVVGTDAFILSSDTLVELDGRALGKPTDKEDAVRMLRALSGKTHVVRTGVAARHAGRVVSGVDSTAVTFRPLSDAEIDAYVAGGEPMDKAGAYGIQGAGGAFVDHIDGDFDTVMGLSARLVGELLGSLGYEK